MKPPKQRLTQKSENALESTSEHAHELSGRRDFVLPEELLRADRQQTMVPSSLAEKLNQAVGGLPAPKPAPWWKRFLS
ncbi:MAG TPA: hypothetical protein VMF06_11640 [Candidatus Limnocylindria bacterium]|jgi:hypothetical protein|nr:hypothetical protein [Candidatus Limnocylindria bacterium]